MRHTLLPIRSRRRDSGFTLIEMLIVAPIVLLIVGGFIALMVSMVGDVLQTRDQNALAYNVQDALDRVEQDAYLSTRFLTTTGTLVAPQGSDANYTGTAAFTSGSGTIIFSQPATDDAPTSISRRLIYYAMQPNPCGSTETFNRIMSQQVVYFIKGGSLWRRTIVPSYNTNATPDANTICDDYSVTGRPWARNSCSPGYAPSTRCETNDEEIMKNIDTLTAKYYSTPDGTNDLGADHATDATAIEVSITGKQTSAGRTFTRTSSLRASKINSLDTDVKEIETPVVSHVLPRPDKVTFSWSGVVGAISYNVSYNKNGGAWQNATLGSGTTSYTVDASRGDTVSFKVSVTGTTGTSASGTDAATMPLWNDLALQNGWENYGGTTFSTAQFTKSSDGTVFLKGLVRNGTTAADTIIATLPDGYRPAGRLAYQASTSVYTNGRIDVDSDGNIRFVSGSNGYISLDGIAFLPSTSSHPWSDITSFSNGWSNNGGAYETLHATKDGIGRVHIQGAAKAGTTASNTTIATPTSPTGLTPTAATHFPAGGTDWTDFWVSNSGPQLVKRGSQATTLMGLQALYYPGTSGSWTSLAFQNGWSNYGTGTNYPLLAYTKAADNVVTIRGVVKGGDTTPVTEIATLPASACPPEREVFTAISSGDIYARIDINSSGKIYFVSGNNTWITVNLSFIVN